MPDVEVTSVEVTHEVTSVSTQQIEVGDSGPLTIEVSDVGVSGPVGPPGDAGAASTVPGPATPVDYQGTGFPEGVLTATVGKTYRDNNATNGAYLWIKATGTGNTGWRVIFGDTGWRNAVSLLNANGQAALGASHPFFRVRRLNDEVQWRCFGSTAGSWSGGIITGHPAGFAPAYADFAGSVQNRNDGAIRPIIATWIATSFLHLAGSALGAMNTGCQMIVDFQTRDAWPASLPGTAVP